MDIVIIDDDEDNDNEESNYIKRAHNLLFEIINNLKEKDLLFLIIQQFNSFIYEDIDMKKFMYIGSILNINDIKLEIFKNINSFYLCSYEEKKLYASIYVD